MKQFENIDVSSLEEAVSVASQVLADGRLIAFSGGGSDLLQQVKDGTEQPDVLINLRTVQGNDQVTEVNAGLRIGGSMTLAALAAHPLLAANYPVLVQAAASVGTPQIRNVGTLAGNITQRPWCWYYRNGFDCFKAGGNRCYSIDGENQLHAIFGGGPSFIVHPSDLAPALTALGAVFNIIGPAGERTATATEFFRLPSQNARYENSLARDELLAGVTVPVPAAGTLSAYHKVMDRQAWTHAVASGAAVLRLEAGNCTAASIVLGGVAPIPWRSVEAESVLLGQQVTSRLAVAAGEAAVSRAQPLARNGYKLPMTSAVVERLVRQLASV